MFASLAQLVLLRFLLAVAMLLVPLATAQAQTRVATTASSDSSSVRDKAARAWRPFLTPQSILAVRILPQQILRKPALAMMPLEVATAAGEKYIGMDPKNIVQGLAVVESPFGTIPYYAVFLQASQPWNLSRFSTDLVAHTEPGEVAGRPALISVNPAMPSLMVLKQNTLLLASPGMMEKLLKPNRPQAEGILLDLVASHTGREDIYFAVDMESVSPVISMLLQTQQQRIPPEMQPFTKIPSLIKSVEGSVVLDEWGGNSTTVHAANSGDADELERLYAQFSDVSSKNSLQQAAQFIEPMRQSSDPVKQAVAAYFDRASSAYSEAIRPKRRGNDLLFTTEGEEATQLAGIAVTGFLVALLLPAVQAAREAARRNQALSNVKSISLAMHNYYGDHNHFPTHAIYGPEGKPLMSWRVALLPYLGEQRLYDQFHLDEPWDSEHNRSLISQMPSVYNDPSSQLSLTDGKSSFLGVVAERFFFTGTSSPRNFQQLADGTSKTLMFVQVNDAEAKTWTQPADWSLNPQMLGGLHPNAFIVGFADGSARALPLTLTPETLLKLLTVNGREPITVDEIQ